MADGKILVIDNSEDIRVGLQKTLSAEGYTVDTASNKLEVQVHLKSKKYDLVIADMIMPGIDGADIATQILKLSPGTFIILTLDKLGEKERAKLGKLIEYSKNIHYLEKPFLPQELLRVTQDAMKNRGLNK